MFSRFGSIKSELKNLKKNNYAIRFYISLMLCVFCRLVLHHVLIIVKILTYSLTTIWKKQKNYQTYWKRPRLTDHYVYLHISSSGLIFIMLVYLKKPQAHVYSKFKSVKLIFLIMRSNVDPFVVIAYLDGLYETSSMQRRSKFVPRNHFLLNWGGHSFPLHESVASPPIINGFVAVFHFT